MNSNCRLLISAAALAAAGSAVAADSYRCTFGDMVRRVEIVYEPGQAVPCEVHYYKDTEEPGERQVLWRAQNEAGYCEARSEELVRQLSDNGWACSSGEAMDVEETPESGADDTETLAPADDSDSES